MITSEKIYIREPVEDIIFHLQTKPVEDGIFHLQTFPVINHSLYHVAAIHRSSQKGKHVMLLFNSLSDHTVAIVSQSQFHILLLDIYIQCFTIFLLYFDSL